MSKITIIGLGPGEFHHLTLQAFNLLKNKDKLFLRTKVHPLVKDFPKYSITYESCDAFYEESESFDQVYKKIADFIISKAKKHGDIQYAVPGDPLALENTVDLIVEVAKKNNIEVEIIPSVGALEAVYALLNIHPTKGLIVLDALDLPTTNYWAGNPTLITQVYNKLVVSELKLKLLEIYPPSYKVKIIKAAGVIDLEEIKEVSLSELDWYDYDHLTSLFLPKIKLDNKFEDLIRIVKRLRGPNGCPWDKEQDHKSLQTALLEESYEVLETIQSGNMEEMCEELGDLLLQVAFHAVLADENYYFNYRDVINGIIKKMIRRHPHVFADASVNDSTDVLRAWEEIKLEEKGDQQKSIVDNIPEILPALLQADKIQRKAARVGFDWEDINDVWQKVYEELQELKEADKDQYLDELGDVLFAVVNLARFLKVDAESALISTIHKFKRRFQFIEKQIEMNKKKFNDYTLSELDEFWELAKKDNL